MSEIRKAVQKLYNTYPFPPDPLLDEPPPGYNWRWHYPAAYNFCRGKKPSTAKIRILDAGCGTGSGTEYLILHNPEADIVAIDLSEKALEVAQERCSKSGVLQNHKGTVEFKQLSIEDAISLTGEFDLINCVGVLHHLPDPVAGIKALASKLAPRGLFHIFVYGELGRWEIQLMQQAIALLQGENRGDYEDGVSIGRQLFNCLPQNNRIVKREKERWALENQRDECFADMYVHPQEVDYNIDTLFELIDAANLDFVGFSNPKFWDLQRLMGKCPELISRANHLTPRQVYRLIELLDPEVTHYEFFLSKEPYPQANWEDDNLLLQAIPERHPCMTGWESKSILDYEFQPVSLSDSEFNFLRISDTNPKANLKVNDILQQVNISLDEVRSLQKRQLIMLDSPRG
jgi:SAM-dependent methyltransferase